MKKYIAIIALTFSIAGTTYAQNAPGRERNQGNHYGRERKDRKENGQGNRDKISAEQRATQRTEMLSQKLDLSSKQKRKVQELNLKHAQQLETLRGQYATADARNGGGRQEMQNLQASWEKDFKKIVSKKQYTKYEAERTQMQAQRGNRGGRKAGENGRFKRPANS